MFAGIDVASERHVLAHLDARGLPLGKPVPVAEDRKGHDALPRLLGPSPVLVAMEATGHYRKNLYAALVAAGHHMALLNPLQARRLQDRGLQRTKTDAIDAADLARFAFEKRPEPTRLHDAAAEALRELVRHRDRIRQDFDDRVRQLHRSVDLGSPEFTRHVRRTSTCGASARPRSSAASTACSKATRSANSCSPSRTPNRMARLGVPRARRVA